MSGSTIDGRAAGVGATSVEATALEDDPFVANGIRLSGREWVWVGIASAAVLLAAPPLWRSAERFEPGPDYRVPHALSEDYWLYERWAERAAEGSDALVVGDSVVWGEYVAPDGTLSHHLSVASGGRRFANLGLAGMHPAPLAGLIEHYGRAITGKRVILHWNPLWLSSPRHDLREDKELEFNHPLLVPQFFPRIPCYREDASGRIGRVVRRNIPFFGWARHLQVAYFDGKDIPAWSIEHPYESPLDAVRRGLPEPGRTLRHSPVSWRERGIREQDFSWVDPETSLQWRSFQRAVAILERRGNRVLVVLGPFNEHLLSARAREGHARVRTAVETWIERRGIPHVAPDPLPSELYADSSHPLSDGYALLAREILKTGWLEAP